MSDQYPGTDLRIDTIDSKAYHLQVRGIMSDGSRTEWGPTAYIPEYTINPGSVLTFDGSFERYTSTGIMQAEGWALLSGTEWNYALTSSAIEGLKALRVTTAAPPGTPTSARIFTPGVDVVPGELIKWTVALRPSRTTIFNYRVVAYYTNTPLSNPTDLSGTVQPNPDVNQILLPTATEQANTGLSAAAELVDGQTIVPDGFTRMSLGIILTLRTVAPTGGFPQYIDVDEIKLSGPGADVVDTDTDQVVTGYKNFDGIAARAARIDDLDATYATFARMYADNAEFGSITKNLSELVARGEILYGIADYPREALTTLNTNAVAATVNSMSVVTPAGPNNPYLALILWTGYGTGADQTTRTHFYVETSTGTTAPLTWVERARISSSFTGQPGGTLLAMDVISSPEYSARVMSIVAAGPTLGYSFPDRGASNRMKMFFVPIDQQSNLTTSKPIGTTYSTQGNDGVNGTPGAASTRRSAKWTGTFGWKQSYDGAGDQRNNTPNLVQGYFDNDYKNQKSAAGNMTWDRTSGQPPSTATGVRVLGCILRLKAEHWYGSGGTAVIGTHDDTTTTARAQYSNITPRSPDLRRQSYDGTGAGVVDLGTNIGSQFYNRSPGTGPPAITGGTASGIVLGPGPSDNKSFFGSFSKANTDLQIELSLEWYE